MKLIIALGSVFLVMALIMISPVFAADEIAGVRMLTEETVYEPAGAVFIITGRQAADSLSLRLDGPAEVIKVFCVHGNSSWGCVAYPQGPSRFGTYTVETLFWCNRGGIEACHTIYLNGSTKGRKFDYEPSPWSPIPDVPFVPIPEAPGWSLYLPSIVTT